MQPIVSRSALALILVAVFVSPAGCKDEPAKEASCPPPVSHEIPRVRVLLADGAGRIRVRSETPFTITDQRGVVLDTQTAPQWREIESTSSQSVSFADGRFSHGPVIQIIPASGETLRLSFPREPGWSLPAAYPGTVRILATATGELDVINDVDVETYVSCVVTEEVWPDFATEAYRGQAIIARTFVLYRMTARSEATYDIVATEAAQVYRGIRSDTTARRAAEATRHTRGIVCAWNHDGKEQLFPTYYHAACGGMSQSAAIFGKQNDIEPLRGRVACDFCKIAPKGAYRWGPIELSTREVLDRLMARYPDLTTLRRIDRIDVIKRTPGGRPLRLSLTGVGGETFEMSAEHFRLAIGAREVRSTDCTISVEGSRVIIKDGRGFGHGLGLCQWGMQGQALAGKEAADILRYYYPGSKLVRAY